MKIKGLNISMIFEAESANYGEGVGNVASLKKITRGSGDQYTYISRQALRYNMIEQLGEELTPVQKEKEVVQFHPEATIEKYPEIDFFGYMKTVKGSNAKTRNAKVRLSNAISLESFKGDLDFLTNKGLADRIGAYNGIAQAEIHRSYYAYTVAIDLDQIGIDNNDNIILPNSERARRVNKLLDTISYLYRDIKGRRENLSPLFIIGGIYDIKNPIFENRLSIKNGKLNVEEVISVMSEVIVTDTMSGIVEGKFINDAEIKEALNSKTIPQFFSELKRKVNEYYESN